MIGKDNLLDGLWSKIEVIQVLGIYIPGTSLPGLRWLVASDFKVTAGDLLIVGCWFIYGQTLHGTAIYAYIGVVWGVNVSIYAIHGGSGYGQEWPFDAFPSILSLDESGRFAPCGRPTPSRTAFGGLDLGNDHVMPARPPWISDFLVLSKTLSVACKEHKMNI